MTNDLGSRSPARVIKRTSLVWKRAELSAAAFRELWLGEHVAYAKQLPGMREYVIDFVQEGVEGAPAGIATVRFDDRNALDAAFAVRSLAEQLARTRDEFAEKVQPLIVEECVVVAPRAGSTR
jgi:uncharacterized protein (TIGR02118 family)